MTKSEPRPAFEMQVQQAHRELLSGEYERWAEDAATNNPDMWKPTVVHRARLVASMELVQSLRTWDAEDKPVPEDEAIQAARPDYADGNYDEYDTAMRLVSAKHSKAALVDLVTWLLVQIRKASTDPVQEPAT